MLFGLSPSCGVEGTQWTPYLEWSFDNPSYSGNPYDLVATVTFTHTSSGEQHTTEMFCDGNDVWKFRFTGTRTGMWTFETSSSDPELNSKTGTVTIKPNPDWKVHGFVKKFDGNKWGWQGTERAFVPQLAMYKKPKDFQNNPEMIDNDISKFLDGHGFTGFHVPSIGGCWFDINKSDNKVTSSMTEPDQRTFEALEMLITKTHAAGGVVHIWAWGDHQRNQTPRDLNGGINGSIDKRLQRYIAARLGPIPGWTMGYGFDLWEWVSGSELTEWHSYMHEHFGWHHFLGARASKNQLNQLSEAMDYSGYEQHKPDYDKYVETIEKRPEKPSLSEDRFRVRDPSPYPDKDYTEELTRRGLWHSTMAGGVANIWGYLVGSTHGGSMPYPIKQQIKTYSTFFNDKRRFLKGMERSNELSNDNNTRVLRGGLTRYVFYRENASSIHMNLSYMEQAQPAVAVDTKKEYEEIDLGLLGPKEQTWNAPYLSDWAIAVGDWLVLESYDWADLAFFARQWLAENCSVDDWCNAADLNKSTKVDLADFAKLAENWKTPDKVPPPPGQASNPDPANDATGVSLNADLSWTAGSGATSHDVYFGPTGPGEFQGNQNDTTFEPGTMAEYTTYFWRIDELNAWGKTIGTVWSFTTWGPPPP